MSTESDPPRLSLGGGALASAIAGARARTPDEALLASVAAHLPSGPPGGGGDPTGGDNGPPTLGTGNAPQEGGSHNGGSPVSHPTPSGAPSPGNKPVPSSRPVPSNKPVPSSRPVPGSSPIPGIAATPSLLPGILVGAALGSVVGFVSLFVPTDPVAPPPSGVTPPSPTRALTTANAPGAPVPSDTAALSRSTPPSSGTGALPSPPDATGTLSPGGSAPSDSALPAEGPDEPESDYLRRAHAQVSGAPAQALALAEAYPRKYPNGKLGQEREIIAIEALSALGRAAEARARARLFLTLFPDSAHRRRLLVLVPDLSAPEKNQEP